MRRRVELVLETTFGTMECIASDDFHRFGLDPNTLTTKWFAEVERSFTNSYPSSKFLRLDARSNTLLRLSSRKNTCLMEAIQRPS
jgi:hypothetical protein